MTADHLKTLTTDALDRLATLLDEGHSEGLTALLKTMGRFHRYSFHNLCLITAQCPTATRVAGFQTWRTMRRFVRKGEKGIAILAPIVGRRHTDAADDDSKTVLGFRAAYVFDIASTDGEPLPEAAEASGDPGSKTAVLRAAIVASGIVVESSDDLDGARGTIDRRHVTPANLKRKPSRSSSAKPSGWRSVRHRRTTCIFTTATVRR